MPKLFFLVGVLAITCICSQAAAQDPLFKLNLFFDTKHLGKASPPVEETDKTNHDIARSLKVTPRVPQQPDIMQYLIERRGKIPIYSGLDGKVQLEVGIAGYLGLKYQF